MHRHVAERGVIVVALTMFAAMFTGGCGPSFHQLRDTGMQRAAQNQWGVARGFFHDAYLKRPENAENLHDLGVCSMMLARKEFMEGNRPAGMREADRAIEYFDRAINASPGFRSAIEGKNRAQELKGQFEAALNTAHWAADYVGPSAEQQIFLANEYEERGDLDGAWLRLQQGLAMDPNSPQIHRAFGDFLLRRGDREAAIRAYRHSFTLDPSQQDVIEKLYELEGEMPVPPVSE